MRDGVGVVLAGAQGMGKTRLAHEAFTRADPRRYVGLWAAATAASAPIPLGALAPLLPADLPGSPVSPVALLGRATDALLDRCGPRRLMLGVDDAHLLDEISAALVHQLARTRRALVLATVQSRCPVPDPIRALWKEALASRVEIGALTKTGTADVLAAALGGQIDCVSSRRLWLASGGNLVFLRELVEAGLNRGRLTESSGVWRWEGPWVTTPKLVELICDRIGRLDRTEYEILELVAHGEPIGADILTALTDRRTVEALESKNLLRARQEGRRIDLRLGNPLHGEVLRAACTPKRAAELRRLLADAVEATGARRDDDWLRIVTWRLDASTAVRSDVVVAAARRAFAILDLPLAERLARTVIDAGAGAEATAAAAAVVLCRVLSLSQRSAEAEELMMRLADAPMPDRRRGDYTISRACNLFWGLHRVDEAFALLRTAGAVIDDPACRDEFDLLACVFQLFQARVEPARRGSAVLRSRPGLSARAAVQLPVVQGVALLHQGHLEQAHDLLEPAFDSIAGWSGELPWVAETLRMYRCYAALFAGRFAVADELARAFHTRAVETEWEFALRLSCSVQAQVARLRGRARTAARWAREGWRLCAAQPAAPFANCLLGELAHAEALAGQAGQALAAMVAADRRPAPSEVLLQPWVELARPWVAVATGNPAGAVDLAAAAAGQARDQGSVIFEAFALHDAVRLGAARTVVDRLHELAGSADSRLVGAFAEHAAAAAAGGGEELEASGAAFAGLGAHLLAAEAYAQAAQRYRRSGSAASDRRLRAQATLLLDGCEGARTPLVAGIEAPQLTARERDIARLAAEGLSNQEIADRMVISIRTVGNHLHHVYAKLGISGRSALAALLPPAGRPAPAATGPDSPDGRRGQLTLPEGVPQRLVPGGRTGF
jgi:DNA-binding CsgD family transcriptional regulator